MASDGLPVKVASGYTGDMKALILYGTRKGCTRGCAEMVREQIGGGDVVDVKKSRSVNLAGYDLIVLGSSIRMDKIHVEVSRFVKENLSILLGKRVGLFICSGDDKTDHIGNNYPRALVDHAAAKAQFGGQIRLEEFGPVMRFMLKKAANVMENYDRLRPDVIAEFSKVLRSGAGA